MKNEVGMAGSKSTQTRDNRIYYASPTLAFLDYYAPINVDVFVECGMWEIFRLFPSCHNGSSLSVLIQSHYYWLFLYPSKSGLVLRLVKFSTIGVEIHWNVERWNGIVEWATMTNDPVPHQLIRACTLCSSA